jgi:hypothetical protein
MRCEHVELIFFSLAGAKPGSASVNGLVIYIVHENRPANRTNHIDVEAGDGSSCK